MEFKTEMETEILFAALIDFDPMNFKIDWDMRWSIINDDLILLHMDNGQTMDIMDNIRKDGIMYILMWNISSLRELSSRRGTPILRRHQLNREFLRKQGKLNMKVYFSCCRMHFSLEALLASTPSPFAVKTYSGSISLLMAISLSYFSLER